MAGKTKKNGARVTPRTPKHTEMPKPSTLGHMGLKSSPYAPTDSKLTTQHMVMDRMAAHYKKVNKARACVDTAPPRSFMDSQKMRDRFKREASKYNPKPVRHYRPRSAMSLNELYKQMDALTSYTDDLEEMDRPHSSHSLRQAEITENRTAAEMQFVNKMIEDKEMPPSRYKTNLVYQSNIPAAGHRSKTTPRRPTPTTPTDYTRQQVRVVQQTYSSPTQTAGVSQHAPQYSVSAEAVLQSTYSEGVPRNSASTSDVLDKYSNHFTEEKPFQPRTLKSNRSSKLSQFKYYNPPKRKTTGEGDYTGEDGGPLRSESAASGGRLRSSLRSRPGTANTERSVDWMDETIVSRDFNERPTPTEVPSLDITMDQDNINWLKEQSNKAKMRDSSRSEPQETPKHSREVARHSASLGSTFNKTGTLTKPSQRASTSALEQEEELQYLQFIQDVTSDVLDRQIFTNRMLKQVFESHIIRKRHLLDEAKMRDKLEDLRIELGISDGDEEETGTSQNSTLSHSRVSRRTRNSHDQHHLQGTATIQKKSLPNLHSRPNNYQQPEHSLKAKMTKEVDPTTPVRKPPLPSSTSKGSSLGMSHDLSATSGRHGDEEDSVFGTLTQTIVSETSARYGGNDADVLKVEHSDDDATKHEDELNGNEDDDDEKETQTMLYRKQLASIERSGSELSDENHGATLKTETDGDGFTARSEEQEYTDRTEGQRTDYTNFTEEDDSYTSRTQSSDSQLSESSQSRTSPNTRKARHSPPYSVNGQKGGSSQSNKRSPGYTDSTQSRDDSESVEVSELDGDDSF